VSVSNNPVAFFEVVGRDAEALQRFYGDAFGWKMQEFTPISGYAMARAGEDGHIGGGIGPAYDEGPGHATFYVEVADVGEALGKIESLGGRRVMGPDEVVPGGLSIALFADPEGHLVGLFKP
jgi:predicted enzyme related to lactoylglutathione lyase